MTGMPNRTDRIDISGRTKRIDRSDMTGMTDRTYRSMTDNTGLGTLT